MGPEGRGVGRIDGIVIGVVGVLLYRRRQNQCSIDPKRQRRNLVLVTVLIVMLGVGFFFTLERLSGWYFDAYVVPAQQEGFAR